MDLMDKTIWQLVRALPKRAVLMVSKFIGVKGAIFGFLEMDVKYTDRHETPERMTRKNEIEILRFESSYGSHFVVGDGGGHVAYDPWGVSRAVRQGRIESKRIFRRL